MSAPYWTSSDGRLVIYHGRAEDVLPSLSADVAICDPPYGRDAYATDVALAPSFLTLIVSTHLSAALFGYPEDLIGWCLSIGRRPDEWVTWWPTNKTAGRSLHRLAKEAEAIAIFGPTPGAGLLKRPKEGSATERAIARSRGLDDAEARMGDVWRDASPGMGFNSHMRLHPNEKPVSLVKRLITLCSSPTDKIVDPTMGSGTTLLAALSLGRRAIGIEIEERYCEIAAKRLEDPPMLAAVKATQADLFAEATA